MLAPLILTLVARRRRPREASALAVDNPRGRHARGTLAVVDIDAWWVSWCAVHDVSASRATIADLSDLALDLHLAGVEPVELVAVVEHAAESSGWWGTSAWASLRLSLPM